MLGGIGEPPRGGDDLDESLNDLLTIFLYAKSSAILSGHPDRRNGGVRNSGDEGSRPRIPSGLPPFLRALRKLLLRNESSLKPRLESSLSELSDVVVRPLVVVVNVVPEVEV